MLQSIVKTKNEKAKVVGICIGFLQSEEVTNVPELEIQDVLDLLLDNPSTITNEEWKTFIQCIADKYSFVLEKIENLQDIASKLKKKNTELVK